uniref:Helitron helicase-like domain-containing protein n=1 Tax=Solanum lycopersicum TaxID=4081 RepID=A0A3Q7FIZ2_SOLLC
MELLSAIIKEYNGSLNISMEVNLLQQLLPELVSLEQMLKQKESTNASTGECSRVNKELGSLKNSRWKYSRLKRKVALIEKQYKNHPKRLIVQLIRFVNRFTKLAKLTNFSSRHVPIHQNGGRVQLPLLREPPPYLKYLLGKESGQLGINFRKNIRAYNSMFAFTSMGGRVDGSINHSKGPYVFRMCGQNYHRIGSLLPEIGKRPQFAQLYICDTENEINNRMNCLLEGDIDPEIVQGLSVMLEEHNILRDIIVEHMKNGLQRISDLHPSFMSMTYPLIHPYGEDGYRVGINLGDVINKTYKRQKLTMRDFYCFRIQQRLNEGKTLLLAGRLLQQYIVDGYMAIEEERFRYIRNNQPKLRADLYSGLMDAILRGDSDCSLVGKTVILPSSHTGGSRYRAQNYQDAMAICRWAGYLDLFLTFTCNPKWPEINEMLCLIEQSGDDNRVDIVCRVFQIKLFQLMQDLKKQQPF